MKSVEESARHFVAHALRQDNRDAVATMLKEGDKEGLGAAFGSRIAFGTAGLRAKMGAGYAYMNELVVCQTSQGLLRAAQTMLGEEELLSRGVVVGYDARYNSETYARITAQVFASKGIPVHLFSETVATPIVAFGVVHLHAALGVMVTASHNPKSDNGYKVYFENGAQIIPPVDSSIADAILQNLVPWDKDVLASSATVSTLPCVSDPLAAVSEAYFTKSKQHSWASRHPASTKVPLTYTAMHGVGYRWVKQAFQSFGLDPLIPVPEQVEPDPSFPTVAYPNPEEGKGALQLAIATAEKHASPVVIANDPDADRLAMAEQQTDGQWRIFSGNEIAALLADWVWKNRDTAVEPHKFVMLASTVSSKFLQSMANKEGFRFVDTLTGFKWMGNVAQQLEQDGFIPLFAYEVEIGFLVGTVNYDKDGVRTAAIVSEMINAIYNQGLNLARYLDKLRETYGFYTMNTSYFFTDSNGIVDKVFDRLRTGNAGSYMDSLDEFSIDSIRDCTMGTDTAEQDGKSKLPVLAPGNHMITYRFSNGSVATIRNSGTESKVKYYVECVHQSSEAAAQKLLDQMTSKLVSVFLCPSTFGLRAPSS